ncbi:MAG: helix-turn-helix domain-containing protein [Chlorobiaceae bacterium]|nr:helix-turn-helix domain-containing protein [Chlorobiaceae bacterium]
MADETPSGGPLVQLALALKSERVRRALSIEDIGRLVNISSSHIEKLENGEFTYLPPLYVFAYLRKYASELGVGDESLLAGCRQELQLPESARFDTASSHEQPGRPGRKVGRRKLLVISAIVLLLLSLLLLARFF